jgi:WD40 repeat protein
MMHWLRLGWLTALVLLAACAPTTPTTNPVNDPAGTPAPFMPPPRDQPTLTPPPWQEPGAVVTAANADQIAYLGRLDTLTAAPSSIFAYSIAPDSTQLAALNNEQIIVWDLLTGQQISTGARQDALNICFSADKSEIYTVLPDGTIQVYQAGTPGVQTTLNGHPLYNGVAACDPVNGLLALGGKEGEVKIWDPLERTSLVTFQAGESTVMSMSFSEDGARLAINTLEGSAGVWDWRARQPLLLLQGRLSDRVALRPDGLQMALAERSQISLWDVSAPPDQTPIILVSTPDAASDVFQYGPDGVYLFNSGGSTGAISAWESAIGRLWTTLSTPLQDKPALAISPDGGLLVTTVLGGAANLWDAASLREAQLRRAELPTGERDMLGAAWTPDGFLLLLFQARGSVQVWGIPRGS